MLMPLFSLLPFNAALLACLAVVWAIAGWSFMAGQQLRLINFAGARAPVVLALNAAAIYLGAALGSAAGGLVIAKFGLSYLGIFAALGSTLALIHLRVSVRCPPGNLSGT